MERRGLQETLYVCPCPYDGIMMFLKPMKRLNGSQKWRWEGGEGEIDRENGKREGGRGKKGRCPKGLRFPDLTHDLTLSTVTLPPRG